jgi:hypothetical protein
MNSIICIAKIITCIAAIMVIVPMSIMIFTTYGTLWGFMGAGISILLIELIISCIFEK